MTVRTPWASLGGAWSSGKKGALKSWNAVGSWIDHRVGGVPSESEAVGVARGFKPDADAIEEAPIPFSAYTVFYVVLALIVFAILWSIFGTLDRIVVAQGRVVTSQPVIVMQPFTISRISQIHVRPGQFVEAGQTLISFDPAFAQADEVSLDQRLRSLNAEIDRMEAELSGNDGFEPGPGADSETLAQAELFTGRKSQLEAELQVRDSRQRQIEAQLDAEHLNIDGLRKQLDLARRVAEIRTALEERDAGSTLETMVAQNNEIDFDLRLQNAIGNRERLLQQRAETIAERQAFLDGWNGDLNQRLVSARQEASQTEENLNKARRMKELTELRSPIDAIVLDLADRSEGSVLREAETLITLVPADAELGIEAQILSRDVGFVAVGDVVRVKLEAYPFQQYGTLEGRLDVVSPDSVPMQENNRNNVVFNANVTLGQTALEVTDLGIRLRPGLVATAEIKAGERSIISYVLDPIMRTADESMREP